MTSKRQYQAEVKKLKDALVFEKAKMTAGAKIIDRMRINMNTVGETSTTWYWQGYHKGREDAIKGTNPPVHIV